MSQGAPDSLHEIYASGVAGHPLALRLKLLLGGLAVDVRTDSDALLGLLRSYFRDFLRKEGEADVTVATVEAPASDFGLRYQCKPPEPGKSKVKEEWAEISGGRVVRKRLTGMVFAFGHGLNLAYGPCVANANQVINFINTRLIGKKLNEGCLLGHAAGVSWQGRGMALAGFSGMGKSTLALHMMNFGLTFVSNDWLMVRRDGAGAVMFGVAKMPRINPGTILHNPSLGRILSDAERATFSRLPEAELWGLEHKYDAMIDECFGPGRFKLQADMCCLALLNWRHGGGTAVVRQIDIAARRELLPAFIKEAGLFFELDEGHPQDFSEDAYVDVLRRVRVYEVCGGADFETAARKLAEILKA